MKEYMLLFRMDITTPEAQPTKEQMQGYMHDWGKWIESIMNKDQLAEGGNHLSTNGKVLRPKNQSSDGPYTVNKESVAGYILLLAKDMDDALSIAKECPILQGEGTSVEIREVASA